MTNNFFSILVTKLRTSPAITNVISCILVAIIGLFINIVIGLYYSSNTLGIFNKTISYYLVISQFSSLGIHYSVLYRSSILSENILEICSKTKILSSAFLGVTLPSLVSMIFSYQIAGLFFYWQFIDLETFIAFQYVLPALPFYSYNRILINFINANKEMNAYAFFATLRHILLLLCLYSLVISNISDKIITIIFPITEIILFLSMTFYIRRKNNFSFFCKNTLEETFKHISFGAKGFASGLVSELNTRIDIIVLSIFCDNNFVGVYSLVVNIYESAMQICLSIRNIINPSIAFLIRRGELEKLDIVLKKLMRKVYISMFVFCSLILITYPTLVENILLDNNYRSGYSSLIILLSGLMLTSGILITDMIFIQSGRPGLQSYVKLVSFSFNLLLNLILVPFLGMTGSALGTSISLIFSIFLQERMIRKHLNFRLIPLGLLPRSFAS